MEISNGRQYQVMASYPLNEVLLPVLDCHKASVSSSYRLHQEINPSLQFQSQSQQALRCPRCASINTKFCYYNNYSLSQPRYFCKSCRRYWTQGGSLRNIPVGGGCRKNKRSSLSSSLSFLTSSSKKLTHIQDYPNPNPVHGFIDVLRSGLMGSTNTTTSAFGGIQSDYFGFGGDNGVMPPFDHPGLNSISNSTATAATAGAITISHGGYLNGAGSTSWNGFINGFSDEMHDGHI